VDEGNVASARAILIGGITAALSPSCAATILHAAKAVHAAGGIVVYDPNFRPRLSTATDAAEFFRSIAPFVTVALPSSPADTRALFGVADPVEVVALCRSLGAASVVVTCGTDGVVLSQGADELRSLPVIPAPSIVDSTGAGDSFAGTLTARLALGDDLLDAVRLGMAAASLSLAGKGGTGFVPTLDQTRKHATGS
jgi:2-dehydro-3-deoxygluconokinase